MQPGTICVRESEASSPTRVCRREYYKKTITMTEKQKETAFGLLKKKRWTEFIMSLPAESTSSWVFENYREMESCKAVGWRINARNDTPRRLRITTNYVQNILTIEVTEKRRSDDAEQADN